MDGELLGTVNIPRTGGSDRWSLETIDVKKATGIQDIYFVFKGHGVGELAYFDYWKFSK
ncbi:carbohydrate-binding protein [Sphingobacterium sp. FBM7-1]|uniref:carbohydrate-binding protein n=1 Tax=Sphingobacterium sp. FBM7-1 TaxID=2886688 RepID=UPI001D1219D9|nr:carbohydrate-binding protein [Sphingobacterium sp. FBM7-1]